MTGEATVVFDPRAVETPVLLEAIRETGYDAEVPAPGRDAFAEQEERERAQVQEARELSIKAAGSLVLGGIAMGLSMAAMITRWSTMSSWRSPYSSWESCRTR